MLLHGGFIKRRVRRHTKYTFRVSTEGQTRYAIAGYYKFLYGCAAYLRSGHWPDPTSELLRQPI